MQPIPTNKRWCGDITYIHTWEGWLYLATVIDIGSRRIVGWATADHLRTDLITEALNNAVTQRRPEPGVIFQSPSRSSRPSKPNSSIVEGRPTRTAAHKAIFEYIEGWYNTRRLHSSLGYLSPNTYENQTPHDRTRNR